MFENCIRAVYVWLIAVVLGVIFATGCISAQRGDFKIRSFGDNVQGTVTYARVDTNGGMEVFQFTGDKNASESTHTVANMIGGIVGACVGTAVSPGAGTVAGAAKGAAVGGGATEIWQTVKDWLKNKTKGVVK
jgi:hypothetical protein